ncbi:hypothetical protein K505DRAFT_96613 [Melanomma pulvis-pyrius CBS 109.77]|uniref:F-box domain-containing protein n=1 Tax=Melanomma pulvis-pyrius CBS 109.77 TaxID=1314802 RepID=A0A6A6WZD4_9PLEO|nr:hypothetical protein K505DRAFT_96613 [Melanomma pulvis-pyrius CBS 109.77]
MTAQLPHPVTAPIPRYHSKTAFSIPLDQKDAIIRVSAYHRKDFDRAVTWFTPRKHSNGVTCLSTAFREPTTSLGDLDRLPLELINEICLQLDIVSLLYLRQTNARARHVINALHEYQIVTTHALDPLYALLRTRSASRVTLLGFYRLLCTQSCSLCKDQYGDLVYLPTWNRCCSNCVRSGAPELYLVTLTTVKRVLHLSKTSLAKLPAFTTLPGIYSMDERSYSSRTTIVPTQSALSAYSEENGGTGPGRDLLNKLHDRPVLTFMACCAIPSYNPQTHQIENGISCAGCQLALQDGISTGMGEWACDVRDMVYSRDGFLKHFVWCEQAQVLWLGSNNGTVEPPKLPYSCKKGGYFTPRE